MSGALCLTFDNLGEAAEVGAGARSAPEPPGSHPTATEALPAILALLAARELAATFFLEGLNAELYPSLLRRIDAEGHEVAYHAWTHEQWGELSAEEQAANLARGLEAFERIGLHARGMRPPGGSLGPGGLEVLRAAGLHYSSPAAPLNPLPMGLKAEPESGNRPVGVVPFEWPLVDASCVIPELEGPLCGPDEFHALLAERLEEATRSGGQLTIVLHPFMLEWHGEERLGAFLDRAASARERGLRVETCREVASRVAQNPSI